MRRAALVALVLLTGCVGGMQPPEQVEDVAVCVAECVAPELTRCAVECATAIPTPEPVSLREVYPEGEVVMVDAWPNPWEMSLCPPGSRSRPCERLTSAAICCEPVP